MAFPFLFEEYFDDGTKGAWDSETDSGSIFDYPHYAEIARQGFAPWTGSHVARAKLASTAVGYVVETTSFDTAAASAMRVWFTVLIGADVVLAASEHVVLFCLDSAGPVLEASFGVRNNAGVYELFFGETGLAGTRTLPITRSNKIWYEVEMSCLVDNAGANDGTLTGYIDGSPIGAAIGTLDQGAITQARFGVVTGTTAAATGTILFGGIIADDARVYPRRRSRYKCDQWVTRDRTVWIGAGELDAVSVAATDTNGVLNIYDTDIYEATGVNFARMPLIYTRNVTASDQSPGMTTPIRFERGVYVQLAAGASPQAFLSLRDQCPASVVMSDANYVKGTEKEREGLMAIKIPAIPEIEDASEMINLVASSAKFKERMTALVDIYDKIKTGLETYKQYQDIDAKFGEAQNLVVEAKQINTDAHEKVAQVKEQEQASLAEITKRHDALEQWYLGARDGAEARDRALDTREALLAKREAEAVKLALESQHALDTNTALIKENDTLRLELESKLAQLRKIAV